MAAMASITAAGKWRVAWDGGSVSVMPEGVVEPVPAEVVVK